MLKYKIARYAPVVLRGLIAGLIFAVVGGSSYHISRNSAQPIRQQEQGIAQSQTKMSFDAIYNDASHQLGISHDKVVYFRIFDEDRVQYSFGNGANFAYKIDGKWHVAASNVQSILVCSTLDNIPEIYRPVCSETDSTSSPLMYTDSNNQSLNYPPSKATNYIDKTSK